MRETPVTSATARGASRATRGDGAGPSPAMTRSGPTRFSSVLFDAHSQIPALEQSAPPFFRDLNLDQIVDAVTRGREEYDLKPFFYTALTSIGTVGYRHDVFQDLEKRRIFDAVATFAKEMRLIRAHLKRSEALHYVRQRQRAFLNAADLYSTAVPRLAADLASAGPTSAGLIGLCDYVADYVKTATFTTLIDETRELEANLRGLRYCILMRGNRITIGQYDGETDYSSEIDEVFAKFSDTVAHEHLHDLTASADMDHIEAGLLDRLVKLFPEIFERLDVFCQRQAHFVDTVVRTFDREIQFYVAYLDHIAPIRATALPVSYPRMSAMSKRVGALETFDLALAAKMVRERRSVVCNDFHLRTPERIIVVTGPNQGGKTTFARTFGQLHYLGSLGCAVPGRDTDLFLCDRIFTHFEREEDLTTLSGKLADELQRVHEILLCATPHSIIIMNEIFTSTTLRDALFLSLEVLGRILELDTLTVCVTFIDELSSLNEKTVSLVAAVSPDDPSVRTFKVERRPADGRAYATAIAQKYGLGYHQLVGRITQ